MRTSKRSVSHSVIPNNSDETCCTSAIGIRVITLQYVSSNAVSKTAYFICADAETIEHLIPMQASRVRFPHRPLCFYSLFLFIINNLKLAYLNKLNISINKITQTWLILAYMAFTLGFGRLMGRIIRTVTNFVVGVTMARVYVAEKNIY